MYRIGIDFDNTIACYDALFSKVASLMDLIPQQGTFSKVDVKAELLQRPDGESTWQRLQGQVYGRHMLLAEVFPGLHEFLCLCKLRGHVVFVVSHKSEFGHFDESRVSLRGQALKWLFQNELFAPSGIAFKEEHVFFESTREEKLLRIENLACTHFIDDLMEVFSEASFPDAIQKILFKPIGSSSRDEGVSVARSWSEITRLILGQWEVGEIRQAIGLRFPELGIEKVSLEKGRGNSRIYRMADGEGQAYCLKMYPDLQIDRRPRLQTEVKACTALQSRGYPIATAVCADQLWGWGIFRWISGAEVGRSMPLFLDSAIVFLERLVSDGKNTQVFVDFSEASECCLSGFEISEQIRARMAKLKKFEALGLENFFIEEFAPALVLLEANAMAIMGDAYRVPLPRTHQCPSPSDFGAHNALVSDQGVTTFYDFEYFGWDDPVKLVSDFYWHPGMQLDADLKAHWLERTSEMFANDPDYKQRLVAYLPLFGLRWCLIMLNPYLRLGSVLGGRADGVASEPSENLCIAQLSKAADLLKQIKELENHVS
jgi:hypothetical protein